MGKHVIDEKEFESQDMIEKICKRKYYKRGEDWDALALRVATYVAQGGKISAEECNKEYSSADYSFWASQYYNYIREKVFIPGGRVLANAGTGTENLYNCFIVDIEDSRDSIYSVLKDCAEISAQGGGVGISFSNLREENSEVKGTQGKASGPVSFMELFDTSAEVIKQGSRRSAMLASIRADHPDILKFIDAKTHGKKLQNFNISVSIPDDLMYAYENNLDYELKGYSSVTTISAKGLLNKIAEAAWKTGDPGILFIDEINRHNPTPDLGEIVCTNPCRLHCTA